MEWLRWAPGHGLGLPPPPVTATALPSWHLSTAPTGPATYRRRISLSAQRTCMICNRGAGVRRPLLPRSHPGRMHTLYHAPGREVQRGKRPTALCTSLRGAPSWADGWRPHLKKPPKVQPWLTPGAASPEALAAEVRRRLALAGSRWALAHVEVVVDRVGSGAADGRRWWLRVRSALPPPVVPHQRWGRDRGAGIAAPCWQRGANAPLVRLLSGGMGRCGRAGAVRAPQPHAVSEGLGVGATQEAEAHRGVAAYAGDVYTAVSLESPLAAST